MKSLPVPPSRRPRLFTAVAAIFGSLLSQSGSLGAEMPPAWPDDSWTTATPADVGMAEEKLAAARDYALTGGGAGCITRHGRLVMQWGDVTQRFDIKSSTKSFGSIALGLAFKDGLVNLDDPARKHHPTMGTPPAENDHDGWLDKITLLHLASQTAGFEKPGGYTPLLFEPGTKWDYSDSGPNWLAECLTLAWKRDIDEVMFERVFTPLGITREDLTWRKNQYRDHEIEGIPRREFGSGISADVDALARIGLLMLREGHWKDRQLLDPAYVRLSTKTPDGHDRLEVLNPEHHGKNASHHYGLLWWTNEDEALEGVPLDAYWSWGLYDSLIVVIPSLDIAIARAGKSWKREKDADHYAVLAPFLRPIVESVGADGDASAKTETESAAPCPPSPVIAGIKWGPPESVIRLAQGSDNWPITWADDDALYTAYGDGKGFEPFLKQKLSLGLARITGNPPEISAENLRSPTAETLGDGKRGRKASGMLMVEGILYMWVRNADNSQLGWSVDHGATWTWADWKFTESFGCPTFLNYGKNYEGARDDYIYVYSQDADSAYDRADRMVLARAPKDRIKHHDAWEFFARLDAEEKPVWTSSIGERGAVFENPGACYRSSVSYHPGIDRYLWCQTGAGKDTRYQGGFAIYDAPNPWGPWTTAYYDSVWDIGPGESSHLPTKWIGDDGLIVHLVFSGDDCFSVRQGRLRLRP